MKVNGKDYRTIWLKGDDDKVVSIIDQAKLPHEFVIADLKTVDDFADAIKNMQVRGAGLIGAAAGYGMYVAALKAPRNGFDNFIKNAGEKLKATRPTAVNLAWAVDRQLREMSNTKDIGKKIEIAKATATKIADEDVEYCRKIGEHGFKIIEKIYKEKGSTVNILTHCNAGWLAFVDFGSATAPMYEAAARKIPINVWVDETRPRNQGAKLTAWELYQQGVPHRVIADNTGGYLMQRGMVDMCITGADRVTKTGDVANKIGTYLKALAAKDNDVPFYVALPSSTFDWKVRNGLAEIPIEERNENEVLYADGLLEGKVREVLIPPKGAHAANYAFDVTPARLITGLITERGVCKADERSILKLFPGQNE
jgi:methylthioribose-1-phosphate isomerase